MTNLPGYCKTQKLNKNRKKGEVGNQKPQKPSETSLTPLAFCTLPPANQTDEIEAVRTFMFLQSSGGVAGKIAGKEFRHSFLARGFTSLDRRCFE